MTLAIIAWLAIGWWSAFRFLIILDDDSVSESLHTWGYFWKTVAFSLTMSTIGIFFALGQWAYLACKRSEVDPWNVARRIAGPKK